MQISTFLAQHTGLSVDELFNAPGGRLVDPHLDIEGRWSFPTWEVPGKKPPTSDAVAAALAAPPAASELIAYANAKQWALATSGFTATVGRTKIPFPTDETSLATLDRKAARLAGADAPGSVNWQTGPASLVEIKAADFLKVAAQVDAFVQATFDALPAVFAAIQGGSIKTFDDVDKADWPKSH